jgi:hypothetical protein
VYLDSLKHARLGAVYDQQARLHNDRPVTRLVLEQGGGDASCRYNVLS